MAGVRLEGVSKIYPGGVAAVTQLDLEVHDGELLVLVGPSGSGKTTTLRLIAGLEPLSAGRITIGGQLVNDLAPSQRGVAMVFQNLALYPHLSVYENMAFGLRLRLGGSWLRRAWRRVAGASRNERSRPAHEIDLRVRKAARNLGIEHLLERHPDDLSGGERQRVAVGRAAVREPAVFLLDEPLSSLDVRLRVELRRELKQLHQRLGTTTLHVTHDQVEAMTMGDRIAVLDRGQLQQVGKPLEVYDRPANRLVAGFLGSPPMNLLEGELIEDAGRTRFASPGWTIALGGPDRLPRKTGGSRRVVLGMRPQDVSLSPDGASTSADRARFSADIAAVEPLGDTSLLHLTPHGGQLAQQRQPAVVLCQTARSLLAPGERVDACIDLDRLHWFHAENGRNLKPGNP